MSSASLVRGEQETGTYMIQSSNGEDRNVLLIAFGQSNADVHTAGPRYSSPLWDDPDILVPDDGSGIRGHMGRKAQPSFTGFQPAHVFEPNSQSLLLAAAARLRSERPQTKVIIRSVGKGGRRILGIDQGDHAIEGLFRNLDNSLSLHYRNLISTIQTTVKSGKEVGIPISQIYLVWIHGESDRALSVDEYIQLLCELIASVGAEIAVNRRRGLEADFCCSRHECLLIWGVSNVILAALAGLQKNICK